MVAEKYLPVGSTDVGHFIREIATSRPDFIFNTLIGEFELCLLSSICRRW